MPSSAAWIQDHRRNILICLLLAVTVWVARYWHCDNFGLYQDDYFRAGPAIELPLLEVLSTVWKRVTHFTLNDGRPIHEVGPFIGAHLGYRLGGLAGIYWLGSLVLVANTILCYFLLQQLCGSEAYATMGALLFAAFPADTTPAFFTSTFATQPGLTFLMGGILCYARGWRITSYVLATGALFTYETTFPAFLAAPLFERHSRRSVWRRWLVHAGIVMSILLVAVGVRKLAGEARVADTSTVNMARVAVGQMISGPYWALWLSIERPLQELRPQLARHPFLLTACFSAFAATMFWLPRPRLLREAPRLLATGVVLLVLAYPFTLTVSADATSGRSTRVHMVAVIGTAILAATAGSLLLGAFRLQRLKILAALPIAALLTAAVASCVRVQHDYALAWDYQRAFWSDLVRLCPDLGERTTVLVDPGGFRRTREADAYGWNIIVQLPLMFRFPESWSEPPRSFYLFPDWRERAARGEGPQEWIHLQGFGSEVLNSFPNSEYIWLEARDGKLRRRTGRIDVARNSLDLKPVDPNAPGYPRRRITRDLLLGEGESPATYLEP